ncbi:MAG TPA: hypothetical protein VHO23_02060 [Candidatus Paceibacterota bacterium]|nr:hypothetical protein [Candidatus Paceibacterota bacterium]
MISSAGAASATPLTHNAPLLKGPPITMVESPYDPALKCLSEHLTPEQKRVVYAVGSFPDRTGKLNFAAPDAAGSFLSQGNEDALMTSLAKTGVQVTNMSPTFRGMYDWIMMRAPAPARKQVTLLVPDVLVSGSMNSLDVKPGGGFEGNAVIKAGRRVNRLVVGFQANATAMPFNTQAQSGQVLTSFAYTKQLVGYENEFGVTDFFGGGSTRTLMSFTIGKQDREALQYASNKMMDVTAYRVVRDLTGQTACDEQFRQAEVGQVSTTIGIPEPIAPS